MHLPQPLPPPAIARPRTPYGVAFQVPELVFIRDWAARRGLTMSVLIDQVLDGAEFEELLLLRGRGVSRQALTLWRTANSVVTQCVGAPPRAFTGVHPALSHFDVAMESRVPRRRRGIAGLIQAIWRRLTQPD